MGKKRCKKKKGEKINKTVDLNLHINYVIEDTERNGSQHEMGMEF